MSTTRKAGESIPGTRTVLEMSLPSLPPGRYHVSWRVVSVDTHVTEGAYAFDVLP
jgi:methionine-rich copper-binding protein CopC